MDAAVIEQAVDEALARGDCDEASRVAAGHPNKKKHVALLERIAAARDAGETPEGSEDAGAPDSGPDTPADAPADALAMFTLVSCPATLTSFNPRAEMHGDDKQPAADLHVRVNMASTVLDTFDPVLRSMFFCKKGGGDLADQAHDAPNLRSSRLVAPFKLATKLAGYTFQVWIGDDEPYVEIDDAQVNAFQIEPKEGGTVVVRFRIQFHPDETTAGRLSMQIGETLDVSLIPPERGGGEIPQPEL